MIPTVALIIWPIIAAILFAALGRPRGLIWSVAVGYLFLPEAWPLDLPGLPTYAKREAIALGVLLGVVVTQSKAAQPPPADRVAKAMLIATIVLVFVSPLVTILTNSDIISFENSAYVIPGLGLWDMLGVTVGQLAALTPFLFAWRYLYDPKMHRELFKAIITMALFYSLFALYEVRMSPQINNMVYGYFPHSFQQHVRGGSFRPLVFLPHGLELGFFLLTALLAAVGLFRATPGRRRVPILGAVAFLAAMLLISRNLGALALCIAFVPVLLFLKPKTHIRIAVIVSIMFMSYPLTRDAYTEPLLAVTEQVSEDRYRSLNFRFINEALMLDRAAERPLAGWGPWGRARVHDDQGRPVTIADGYWIIVLAMWGWLGFFGFFGLLILPVMLIRRSFRFRPPDILTSTLALLIAVNLIYNIPNATLSPLGWLTAGALAGYILYGRSLSNAAAPAQGTKDAAPRRRAIQYTRFQPQRSGDGPARHSRFS